MAQVYSQQDGPPAVSANGVSASVHENSKTNVNVSSLPMRKRKQENATSVVAGAQYVSVYGSDEKKMKGSSEVPVAAPGRGIKKEEIPAASTPTTTTTQTSGLKQLKRPPMPKAREIRLEQNRKAARESRRRKKIMVEELQRSVVFFSRANTTLKQQNEELQRILLQAQSQIQSLENSRSNQVQTAAPTETNEAAVNENVTKTVVSSTNIQAQGTSAQNNMLNNEVNMKEEAQHAVATAQAQQVQKLSNMTQQTQAHQAAQAAATQAMFESQGFPPAAARAAAQTFVAAPTAQNVPETKESQNSSDGKQQQQQQSADTNAIPQTGTTMTANPWPFLVAMAPGQLSQVAAPHQIVAAGAIVAQGKTEFNPYFAMQMSPFLTTVLGNNGAAGLGLPMMQLAGLNGSNVNVSNVSTSGISNQNAERNTITNTNGNDASQNKSSAP